jgi:hypothetical protein
MTRTENEYVADQVERSHGRLVGFFSVDPLSLPAADLMGLDFDFSTPRATDDLARAKLPLSEKEWRKVARNCAPWACSSLIGPLH